MRMVRAAATAVVLTGALWAAPSEAARTPLRDGTAVPVEVLTSDTALVADAITALGGHVTGSVEGEVVQAMVPAGQVRALAATPGAEAVQSPHNVSQLANPYTRIDAAIGTGTPGNEVALTNADAWHTANYTGQTIKVGIVDYFDLSLWNTAEHGPTPTAGNSFCLDTAGFGLCSGASTFAPNSNGQHGVAVAEIVKDMAPGAQLYLATASTVSDLRAAIDWFAANGVTILTRSLGAAYDGPGDGTGPLDAVVDYAVEKGITWFNSGGNGGVDNYVRRTVPTNLATGGYVDFDPGAGVDTWLRLDGANVALDGVRWANDWYLPAAQKSDYSVEFWVPTVDPTTQSNPEHWDPTGNASRITVVDAHQTAGANPLEAADMQFTPTNSYGSYGGITYLRIKLNPGSSVGATPDAMEIALASGLTELGYSQASGSSARPVVDSRSIGLIAVGAVDPAAGSVIAPYSSQGPTTDGRIKPDLSAPSGLTSTIYTGASGFQGTSAAAPTAAGAAAILQGAHLANPLTTSALLRSFATEYGDLGAPGADNVFGAGKLVLPDPPAAPALGYSARSKYVPLGAPTRVLDTRPAPDHVGPAVLTGPYPTQTVFEFHVLGTGGVPTTGVSAVAINLTSVGSLSAGYVQAYPSLRATTGATSTLNISSIGGPRPNFAVVPVGEGGNISVFLPVGGEAVIDVMGYFADNQTTSSDGRFVPIPTPERWMDTRGLGGAPLPLSFGGRPRLAAPGEVIDVPVLRTTAVPATGVSALVVTLTAADASANGFLRVMPKGMVNPQHSNLNCTPESAVANVAIVPLGANGQLSVGTQRSVNIILDVVGYITSGTTAAGTTGLFMPITPGRAADTRLAPPSPLIGGSIRRFQITALTAVGAPVVPGSAIGISGNLTVTQPQASGWLKVFPGFEPPTSNLNYGMSQTVAAGALLKLDGSGGVNARMSKTGHVIIDVNGYFLP